MDVNYGLMVLDPKPVVRFISNPEPASWTKTLMARTRNTLGDRIRRGEFRSAWDDYETEADAFAGQTSADKVAHNRQIEEDRKRYDREQEVVRERQEEAIERVKQAQLLARQEAAQEALEQLDGYGSF